MLHLHRILYFRVILRYELCRGRLVVTSDVALRHRILKALAFLNIEVLFRMMRDMGACAKTSQADLVSPVSLSDRQMTNPSNYPRDLKSLLDTKELHKKELLSWTWIMFVDRCYCWLSTGSNSQCGRGALLPDDELWNPRKMRLKTSRNLWYSGDSDNCLQNPLNFPESGRNFTTHLKTFAHFLACSERNRNVKSISGH